MKFLSIIFLLKLNGNRLNLTGTSLIFSTLIPFKTYVLKPYFTFFYTWNRNRNLGKDHGSGSGSDCGKMKRLRRFRFRLRLRNAASEDEP
jgi:hypothetical protein